MSNTSNEQAEKGSKFWMQNIVNENNFAEEISEMLGEKFLNWISPLKYESYKEYKLNEQKIFSYVFGLSKEEFKNNFAFWANNQPQWDAIATSADRKILYLFEAKAHLKELQSKIRATDKKSIEKIINSMKKVFEKISSENADFSSWTEKYYQLGNRITFLYEMNQITLPKIEKTILILLNITDDKTYISTSKEEWQEHYEKVFKEMTGKIFPPQNAKILYFSGENNVSD